MGQNEIKIRTKKDLKNIYIRAKVNDKWDSYSLQELLDQGHGREIINWFNRMMAEYIISAKEGDVINETHALNAVMFLELTGLTIYELRDEDEDEDVDEDEDEDVDEEL